MDGPEDRGRSLPNAAAIVARAILRFEIDLDPILGMVQARARKVAPQPGIH